MKQDVMRRLEALEARGLQTSGVEIWDLNADGSYTLAGADATISAASLQNRMAKYPRIVMIIDDILSDGEEDGDRSIFTGGNSGRYRV